MYPQLVLLLLALAKIGAVVAQTFLSSGPVKLRYLNGFELCIDQAGHARSSVPEDGCNVEVIVMEQSKYNISRVLLKSFRKSRFLCLDKDKGLHTKAQPDAQGCIFQMKATRKGLWSLFSKHMPSPHRKSRKRKQRIRHTRYLSVKTFLVPVTCGKVNTVTKNRPRRMDKFKIIKVTKHSARLSRERNKTYKKQYGDTGTRAAYKRHMLSNRTKRKVNDLDQDSTGSDRRRSIAVPMRYLNIKSRKAYKQQMIRLYFRSGRYLSIAADGSVKAMRKPGLIRSVFLIVSYRMDAIAIWNVGSQSYMCVSKEGCVHSRPDFHKGCLFHRAVLKNDYWTLYSIHRQHVNWFISHNKTGNAIIQPGRQCKRNNCQFSEANLY